MDIRVTVSKSNGEQVQHEWQIHGSGDLHLAVAEAMKLFHQAFPNSEPFDHTISIDRA
ncbi:hypothetical protein WJT74_05090 [Sphingomicrobium sp. XHP0239]|uniref:hypothetical protein n=1 Tax=Sphingomicrobium maritimum TaxID=3133972 RepID=UPI0031CC665E